MTSVATTLLSENQVAVHEFVNSLSSVRSLSELLTEYPGLDAGHRSQFIGIIRDETERLVQLVARLGLNSNQGASL
jgi:nitrogen-specific signal transduction histidine kinase